MTLLSPRDPVWLERLREAASLSFAALGWPTRRLEDWRYSRIDPITETEFAPAPVLTASPGLDALIAAQDRAADLVVFVNGRFSPAHSRIGALPMGMFLGSFAHWAAGNPDTAGSLLRPIQDRAQSLTDLNTGSFTDGLALILPAGMVLPRPLRCLHWSESDTAISVHTRGHIVLGESAQASVLEIWAGGGQYWNNAVMSGALGAGSLLRFASLQNEALTAFHTASVGVSLAERARFDGFQLMLGGANVRREYRAALAGPAADFNLNGSTLLSGRQSAATVTLVDHTAAGYASATKTGTTSRQVFKVALAERAHAAFQGRIIVRPDAQKTDAGMLNKTMLLSDRAVVDSKPELEIYADDVKCSHGASVGDLDEAALFYLISRGIDPEAARRILIDAFVTEPVELVDDESVAELLRQAIATRLETLG